MTDLGLDQLTPDQLVELLRAVCQEGARRSIETQAAMQDVILSEAEAARIARAAADEELRRIRLEQERDIAETAARKARESAPETNTQRLHRKSLEERDRLLRELGDWPKGLDSLTITAWRKHETGERRIYLDTPGRKYCLYVTGNDRYSPGKLTVGAQAGSKPYDAEGTATALAGWGCDLKSVLAGVADRWSNLKLEIARAQ